jgi:polysaccharide pyruvyl transferase WcaK-like protein
MDEVVGEKTPTTASDGCGSFISILMKAARSLNNPNTSSGKSTMPFEHSTFRWFANAVCTAYAVDLLPSFIQH